MSIEATSATEINSKSSLLEAITDLGFEYVVHKKPVSVSGFKSKKKIDIQLDSGKLYGSAGFTKNKNGKYTFVYDSTDEYKLKKFLPTINKEGKIVSYPLMQSYLKYKVNKMATAGKFKMSKYKQLENGALRVVLQK